MVSSSSVGREFCLLFLASSLLIDFSATACKIYLRQHMLWPVQEPPMLPDELKPHFSPRLSGSSIHLPLHLFISAIPRQHPLQPPAPCPSTRLLPLLVWDPSLPSPRGPPHPFQPSSGVQPPLWAVVHAVLRASIFIFLWVYCLYYFAVLDFVLFFFYSDSLFSYPLQFSPLMYSWSDPCKRWN